MGATRRWTRWVDLGVGHSLGGSIGSWVHDAISPVDEVGRSVGRFVVRSRQWTRWVDRWVGSWRDLTGVGVRGAILSDWSSVCFGSPLLSLSFSLSLSLFAHLKLGPEMVCSENKSVKNFGVKAFFFTVK